MLNVYMRNEVNKRYIFKRIMQKFYFKKIQLCFLLMYLPISSLDCFQYSGKIPEYRQRGWEMQETLILFPTFRAQLISSNTTKSYFCLKPTTTEK